MVYKSKQSILARKDLKNAWYNKELQAITKKSDTKLSVSQIEALYLHADNLRKNFQGKMDVFEEKMIKTGTISDRIATIILLIQRDIVGHLNLLDSLLNLCASKSSRHSELAIEATADLFIQNVLPSRALTHFKDQKLAIVHESVKNKENIYDDHLIFWFVEETIKTKYKQFVSILKEKSLSLIENVKEPALKIIRSLIRISEEQREELIRILINKLNDKDRKISGRCLDYLLNVTNPTEGNPFFTQNLDRQMAVKETASFIFSPKVNTNSKLYAIRYLSFIELNSERDKEIARVMIDTYIKVLNQQISLKDFENNIIGATLSGIYRALSWGKLNPEDYLESLKVMFDVARKSHFNISVEALRCIWKISDASRDPRLLSGFYHILYSRIIEAGNQNSHTSDLFLNILVKAVKADVNIGRSKAIVKRLLQTSLYSTTPFTCAALIKLREIIAYKPGLKTLLTESEQFLKIDDDEEERFFDVPEDKITFDEEKVSFEGDLNQEISLKVKKDKKKKEEKKEKEEKPVKNQIYYNLKEPYPEKSHSDKTVLWEIDVLNTFFHPSVTKISESVMNNKRLEYNGDPMVDYTLMKFLDKFNYKKPKEDEKNKKNPLNSEEFANLPLTSVKEDDLFHYNYTKEKLKQKRLILENLKKKKEEIKQNKLIKNQKLIKIQESMKDDFIEEKEESGNYRYSYDDLDKVLEVDTLDDEQLDGLLMQLESSDDESGDEKSKKKKKKKDFGYDVTSGELEVSSKANQDEIQDLLEPETESEDEEKPGQKRKNRWSAKEKMKNVKVKRPQKEKKEKK